MGSSAKHTLDIAGEYLAAFAKKDLVGMGKHLHPDMVLVSPLGTEYRGKETMLQALERRFPLFTNFTMRAMFSNELQVVAAYDLEHIQPIGVVRVTALLTFQGNLIIRLELFFDAHPLFKQLH